jgi:hypothetical protein
VIVVMAITLVFLAPFVLLALGVVSSVLLVIVWLKAAIRGRRLLASFGPAEGALALSALVFTLGAATAAGFMIVRLGLGDAVSLGNAMLPIAGVRPGERSVHFSDEATRQRLKDGLTRAGVPFRVRTQEGKEYVGWSQEHDAAAEKVLEVAKHDPGFNNPSSTERRVGFGDAKSQQDFVAWLAKRGIKSDIVRSGDTDFVVWQEEREIREIMKAYWSERVAADCNGVKGKKSKC